MIDPTPKPASRPWQWPAEWVKEEKFWKDIGSRTLGGIVTATIVYLGALLLGYLHTPEIGAGVLLALGLAASGILAAIAVALGRDLPARMRQGRRWAARMVVVAVLLMGAVTLAVNIVADYLSR